MGLGVVEDSGGCALIDWKVKSPELGRRGFGAGTDEAPTELVAEGAMEDKVGMLPYVGLVVAGNGRGV